MKCPVCTTVTLQASADAQPPQRLVCGECGGQWVRASQYWKWLDAHGQNLPETPPESAADLPVVDTTQAKLCPECGHLLTRRKVGHGIDFHVDRCATCGGFWFDRNEWEVLVSRDLHDDVHFIFSAAWQHQLAEEEQRATYEKRIEAILGADDFAKVRAFRQWAHEHEQRGTVMAFLANLDM